MKVLMVCLGNICRSPLAEGILQQKALERGLNWVVESAGTNGYHNGEPPHPLSQKVARLHGIQIGQQRSRKFMADDYNEFDLIYAMAGDVLHDIKRIAGRHYQPEKTRLLLEELYPGENRDVPDPWYGTEPGYHEVFELLNMACEQVIEKYASVNPVS
jgi:protein-tyrosine phosphatase